MINEPVKHDQNYPPTASAGGDNAYYLKGCEAVQRSPSYAACLFKIGEIEAGRESALFNDCATAVRSGKCLAREMRDQERLAGAALYYFPRRAPQALHVPFAAAGDFGVRITNLTDPALIPKERKTGVAAQDRKTALAKPKPVDPLDAELDAALGTMSDGYAAAINASIAAMPPPKPAPAPAPTPAPVAKPAPAPVENKNLPRPPMQAGETPLQYARRLAAARNAVPA